MLTLDGLPALPRLNLLAAACELVDAEVAEAQIVRLIVSLSNVAESIDAEEVRRDINDERTVSGFPEVKLADQVETELQNRFRAIKDVLAGLLNRMPPQQLVATMTAVVSTATADGEVHAPKLIDDLVDTYQVNTQAFLSDEESSIDTLIERVRKAVGRDLGSVTRAIGELEKVTRNWDKIAQPIQLSMKARGLDHDASSSIAQKMRSLGIDLFNEHGLIDQAKQITELLRELFAELPEMAERAEEDAEALEDIYENRRLNELKRKEWEQSITYQAEFGMIFKNKLSISPAGASWGSQKYPLESITQVRWGGVRNQHGIQCTVAFGDERSMAVATFNREDVFHEFTQRLMKAVGAKIIGEILTKAASGETFRVGNVSFTDNFAYLTKHKFFGSEQVWVPWGNIKIWTADGSVLLGAVDDPKCYVEMPFLTADNAHLMEAVIRMFFKHPTARKLSDLLVEDE